MHVTIGLVKQCGSRYRPIYNIGPQMDLSPSRELGCHIGMTALKRSTVLKRLNQLSTPKCFLRTVAGRLRMVKLT